MKTFTFWGLTFKPSADDMRELSLVEIIQALVERSAKVKMFEPKAMSNTKDLLLKVKDHARKAHGLKFDC